MSATKYPRQVVVDDTDVRIQYSGSGWFPTQTQGTLDTIGTFGVFGPPFQHTSHRTASNGTISYSYKGRKSETVCSHSLMRMLGSTISVYGTTDIHNISGVLDPTWECFLDGQSLEVNMTSFLLSNGHNNIVLCQANSSVASDSDHELVVKIASSGSTLWFDNFLYTPPATIPITQETLRVDDSDAGIVYSHGWAAWGETATWSLVPTATMTFEFIGEHPIDRDFEVYLKTFIKTGRSISWVGMVPTTNKDAPFNATYSIDNGDPVSFLVNDPSQPSKSNQYFFYHSRITSLLPLVTGVAQWCIGWFDTRLSYNW